MKKFNLFALPSPNQIHFYIVYVKCQINDPNIAIFAHHVRYLGFKPYCNISCFVCAIFCMKFFHMFSVKIAVGTTLRKHLILFVLRVKILQIPYVQCFPEHYRKLANNYTFSKTIALNFIIIINDRRPLLNEASSIYRMRYRESPSLEGRFAITVLVLNGYSSRC